MDSRGLHLTVIPLVSLHFRDRDDHKLVEVFMSNGEERARWLVNYALRLYNDLFLSHDDESQTLDDY
jgi:hypothetical protein